MTAREDFMHYAKTLATMRVFELMVRFAHDPGVFEEAHGAFVKADYAKISSHLQGLIVMDKCCNIVAPYWRWQLSDSEFGLRLEILRTR